MVVFISKCPQIAPWCRTQCAATVLVGHSKTRVPQFPMFAPPRPGNYRCPHAPNCMTIVCIRPPYKRRLGSVVPFLRGTAPREGPKSRACGPSTSISRALSPAIQCSQAPHTTKSKIGPMPVRNGGGRGHWARGWTTLREHVRRCVEGRKSTVHAALTRNAWPSSQELFA